MFGVGRYSTQAPNDKLISLIVNSVIENNNLYLVYNKNRNIKAKYK